MAHVDRTSSGMLPTGMGCVIAHARVDVTNVQASATGATACLPHVAPARSASAHP